MSGENESTGHMIGELLDRFQAREPALPGEQEYLAEDGLIYCSVCRQPKQTRIKMMGKEVIVHCICKCRKDELEQEKKRLEQAEQQRRIERLKANGIQEKHLLDWRFEVAEDTRDIQVARKYVENWKKVKAENLGLLLWGMWEPVSPLWLPASPMLSWSRAFRF